MYGKPVKGINWPNEAQYDAMRQAQEEKTREITSKILAGRIQPAGLGKSYDDAGCATSGPSEMGEIKSILSGLEVQLSRTLGSLDALCSRLHSVCDQRLQKEYAENIEKQLTSPQVESKTELGSRLTKLSSGLMVLEESLIVLTNTLEI